MCIYVRGGPRDKENLIVDGWISLLAPLSSTDMLKNTLTQRRDVESPLSQYTNRRKSLRFGLQCNDV